MSWDLKPHFSVQTFRVKGRGFEADRPQSVANLQQALRRVERLTPGQAGAVVVRHTDDPALGAECDPVVVRVVGQVPAVFLEWVE